MVYADGVDYAELTASAIQSRILRYERLLNTTEDTKIRGLFAINVVIQCHVLGFDNAIHFCSDSIGLDYHFNRKELYLTQNNHCITRVPVILVETTMLSSLRKAAGNEYVTLARHMHHNFTVVFLSMCMSDKVCYAHQFMH